MAPLQKRAWLGIAIGGTISAAVLGILIINGATSFYDDNMMRWTVTGLIIGMLAAWAVLIAPFSSSKGRMKALYDERDEAVLRRASGAQLWGIIGALLAWSIALTEIYWDQGTIPIVFPYLIFWSILMVNTLSQGIGILIGYRRMG
ncbi:MAG: hypothetical protein JSV02_00070 [Dehalococcoidia bacterium]|nr:MAG: hypothetical protein JSV02_00070 [Dehalococcoidia bacterium]